VRSDVIMLVLLPSSASTCAAASRAGPVLILRTRTSSSSQPASKSVVAKESKLANTLELEGPVVIRLAWNEQRRVSSTLIIAPALSNSPQSGPREAGSAVGKEMDKVRVID